MGENESCRVVQSGHPPPPSLGGGAVDFASLLPAVPVQVTQPPGGPDAKGSEKTRSTKDRANPTLSSNGRASKILSTMVPSAASSRRMAGSLCFGGGIHSARNSKNNSMTAETFCVSSRDPRSAKARASAPAIPATSAAGGLPHRLGDSVANWGGDEIGGVVRAAARRGAMTRPTEAAVCVAESAGQGTMHEVLRPIRGPRTLAARQEEQ